MIRIAITVEAFDAIVATLPVGRVAYEAETNAKGACEHRKLVQFDTGGGQSGQRYQQEEGVIGDR